ncbi:unnamed protein product [Linum trigynum]|uniref:Reverse transcriptase zinc-binding domain-containing protein n=1 Tax=Linum trigynum TaxID=586398 RepID=A0AAV2FNQ9_9ROSI
MQEEGIGPRGDEKFWKAIWTMKVPPKVRHFLWKFSRDILPTGVKVVTKNPQRSDECPFCDQKETQHHLFLECSWSSQIGRGSPWESAFTVHGSSDCMKLMAEVMKHESLDLEESWAMVLWAIWKEKNAHLFNGPKWPEDEILQRALSILDDYRKNQGPEEAVPGDA